MKTIILIFLLNSSLISQEISDVINKWKAEPLTTANVARAILDMQIDCPVDVFYQTIKESGWKNEKTAYKSKLATIGNNLFGMRKAKRRLTTALQKTYCGYATYSHWIYSVLDYKYWQESKPRKLNESYSQYLLRRCYARNTRGYIKKLRFKLTKNLSNILEVKNVKKNQSKVRGGNIELDYKKWNDVSCFHSLQLVFRFRKIYNGYNYNDLFIQFFRNHHSRNCSMEFYKDRICQTRRHHCIDKYIQVDNDSNCSNSDQLLLR